MEKEFNLSKKINGDLLPLILASDVKEKIQNAQRRLKREIHNKGRYKETEVLYLIDKIFLECFGDKLVEESK